MNGPVTREITIRCDEVAKLIDLVIQRVEMEPEVGREWSVSVQVM